MKHAIVTGGTGVTGNALVRSLLERGVRVTALVRPGSFRRKYLPADHPLLEVVDCTMEQYPRIHERLSPGQYDAFFHLSWDGSTGTKKLGNRNDCLLQTQNILYAIEAVRLCARLGCPTFLMTGSQAQYGRKSAPARETDVRRPENAYGMAKQCAEEMTRLLCREYGIRHLWPILFSVYGPNDGTESLIDKSVRGLLEGRTMPYTAGEQRWDYLYSFDAAKALIMLAELGESGETYNVAAGVSRPLREYIQELYETLAPGLAPRLGELPYSENALMYLGADVSKLRGLTGFAPDWTFRAGIGVIAEAIRAERGEE